jgi:hypothetical protein
MTKKNLILEHFADTEDVLFADGFDDAIIGFDPNLWRVVYSRNKCIEILMKEGDSELDAIDFLEYNTFNTFVGEKTPVWAEDFIWDCE